MSETLTAPAPSSTASPPTATSEGAAAPAGGEARAAAWYESFQDPALKSDPTVLRAPSAEALARDHLNLLKRYGIPPERRIDLPEDPTDPKQMRGVWEKLGAPAKPEGYGEAGLKLPDGASDGDKALLGDFIAKAHEIGMPASMAKTAFEWWLTKGAENIKGQEAAAAERARAGETALKAELGGAYDARIREVVTLLGVIDPEGKSGLTPANLTAFPELTRALLRVADMRAEPGSPGPAGQGGGPDRPMTPQMAKAELAALEQNPEKAKALYSGDHPSHRAVLAERNRLLAIAEGRAPR